MKQHTNMDSFLLFCVYKMLENRSPLLLKDLLMHLLLD